MAVKPRESFGVRGEGLLQPFQTMRLSLRHAAGKANPGARVLSWSPVEGDRRLVIASGCFLVLLDTAVPRVIDIVRAHQGQVESVKWVATSRDIEDSFVVACGKSGDVSVWKVAENSLKLFHRLAMEIGSLSALDVAMDGNGHVCIAVVSDSGSLSCSWLAVSTNTWHPPSMFADVEGFLGCVGSIFLKDSRSWLFAVAGTDKRIHLFLSSSFGGNLRRLCSMPGHEDWIRSLEWKAWSDGSWSLCSCSQDTYIRVWTVQRIEGASSLEMGAEEETNDGEYSSDSEDGDADANNSGGEGETPITTYLPFASATLNQYVFSANACAYGVVLDSVMAGHEDWVSVVTWSPIVNEKRLISCSVDKSVALWAFDGETDTWFTEALLGSLHHVLSCGFTSVSLSTDGTSLAATGTNGSSHCWEWNAVRSVWESRPLWSGHAKDVRSCAFAPGSPIPVIATAAADQSIRLWASVFVHPGKGKKEGGDVSQPEFMEIGRPLVHGWDLVQVAWCQNALLVLSEEKVVRILDAPSNWYRSLEVLTQTPSLDDQSYCVGASVPALGLSNKAVRMGQEVDTDTDAMSGENFQCIPQAFTTAPIESQLSASSLWPEGGKLFGHANDLSAVTCQTGRNGGDGDGNGGNGGGDLIISACKGTNATACALHFWQRDEAGEEKQQWEDRQKWQTIQVAPHHTLTVTSLHVSEEGLLLSTSRDRKICLWQQTSSTGWQVGWQSVGGDRIVWDGCFLGGGSQMFATCSRDKHVKLYSYVVGEEGLQVTLQCALKLRSGIRSIAPVSPNTLALGMEDGQLELYAIAADKKSMQLSGASPVGFAGAVQSMAIYHQDDWHLLAACSEDGFLHIYDIIES